MTQPQKNVLRIVLSKMLMNLTMINNFVAYFGIPLTNSKGHIAKYD